MAVTPSPLSPAARRADDSPQLDAERLDAYRVALEFLALVPSLHPRRACGDLRDQLERAGSSVLLNLAEGAGRFAPLDKARFFGIARGSAMECAAVLDVLHARGLAPVNACREARFLLVRIVQMLTRLVARMAHEAARARDESQMARSGAGSCHVQHRDT